jgi:hypothetical protein
MLAEFMSPQVQESGFSIVQLYRPIRGAPELTGLNLGNSRPLHPEHVLHSKLYSGQHASSELDLLETPTMRVQLLQSARYADNSTNNGLRRKFLR